MAKTKSLKPVAKQAEKKVDTVQTVEEGPATPKDAATGEHSRR